MKNEELLNAVFRFKYKTPSDSQEAATCDAYAKFFSSFVSSLEVSPDVPDLQCGRVEPLTDDRVVPASAFAAHEIEALQRVAQRLTAPSGSHQRGDVWYDPWLPKYGCVVQRTQKSATEVKIDVLYVDKWEHKLHFLPSGESVHSAVPTTHGSFHCADLDSELETKFSTKLGTELAKALAITGDARSAARNELGHQKTPQFIAAVVRRTVNSLLDGDSGIGPVSLTAGGGTTDVGLHTGGRARDTCWAVVQAVIERNLCCGEGLFRKTTVALQLKLIREASDEMRDMLSDNVNVGDGCSAVDDLFFMLQVIVQNIVELLGCGYEASALQTQCTMLRCRIESFVNDLNLENANRYALPDDVALKQLNELSSVVEMAHPKRSSDRSSRESTEERHQRAWANLEGCDYADGASCALSELLMWVKSYSSPTSYKSILMLRTMEAFMFEKSKVLIGDLGNSFDLELLHELVMLYQQVVTQWRKIPHLTSVLEVEQRSREMLVKWVAFCLAHQTCVQEVRLCTQYNIALNWRDLKVAVLSCQTAIAALQRVARYIRTWNTRTGQPPLFHLTNQGPTFDFGLRFGLNCDAMVDVYNREVGIWDAYVRGKWGEVEAKKKRAAELRDGISLQNQELSSKGVQLANEEERLRSVFPHYDQIAFRWSHDKYRLEAEIQQISFDIQQKEAELVSVLALPPYLTRPLPSAKNDAIQVIFMLTMPRNLEILGSLCFIAQRALTPPSATSEMTTLPTLSPTEWQAHYSQHSPAGTIEATTKVFATNPAPFSFPSWGPQSIDELYSLNQYSSDCIWNPSLVGTTLTWVDSFGVKVDPFAATESSVIASFVENLPRPSQKLQWMNDWPGEGDTRGNMVYANFLQQPDGFEKASFVALASLRAFPNQQYRKLMWALLDDILPWSDSCVGTIVRQSLYQVGTLTDEANPQLLWKSDMHRGTEGLGTFCATLDGIAKTLEHTPRDFENVPLLSELAGFALQYSSDARATVMKFSRMARRWAEDARLEYKEESDPKLVGQMRQKECVLYGFALLAHSLGPLNDEAAQEVCELVVLFRTAFLCSSINERCSDTMLRTDSKIAEMMSRRIPEVVNYVQKDCDRVLTGLVRLASATSPDRLKWSPFCEAPTTAERFGSCFEAVDEVEDVHYSINLFTGTILTDGYPPGGLPTNIRKHKRFEMLFGQSNFEVFTTNCMLRTERKFCDRFYDFALEKEELIVQELTAGSSGQITSTLQLCSVDWIKSLRDLFPAQLRKLYSHWFWVEKNCVLFRPKKAECREVLFIATIGEDSTLQCYKVPFSDTKRPYEELVNSLGDYDHFVQKDGALVRVFQILTKLESPRFIYPLRSAEGVLKIELPRFKLTFSLNSSMRFESVEHKGYVLATSQQFDDFLPRFSRYLLLELQDNTDITRSELRMLLPVGTVKDTDGMVDVCISKEAGSRMEVFSYDVHRRLRIFETETVGARLQLAAVCTRAGVNVPCKRLQMTGSEAAVQLLRACRSSRPFSTFEKDTLLTVYKLSYREPAVRILAVALLQEAGKLAFLFGQTQTINVAMAGVDERTEYAEMCMEQIQRNPLRSQLRRNEETFILGNVAHLRKSGSPKDVVECEPLPIADDYVKSVEMELQLFLKSETSTVKIPPLPLQSSTANKMSKKMLAELHVSWESYHSQPQANLKAAPHVLLESFTTQLSDVSSRRCEMEKYLRDSFTKAVSSQRDQLLMLANFLPQLTVSDIVQCAFDEEKLHTLAPKFSEKSRKLFRRGVLLYMELCVLEDKIERLIWKVKRCGDLSDDPIVNELNNIRQWQSEVYPYWLAFEVEGRLQIRHEQFIIAQHLIDRPGTVCQLNMGCGKTRVILPMLFLYFTRKKTNNLRTGCSQVVRAHFLSPLLSEARQFMHRYLLASSACLGIYEQPFHRQVDLNARRLKFIRDALEDLKLFGGIQMVAPEHRMSLELKRLELGDDGPITKVLDEILDGDQYVDVLDECDALLHHKYHLVYAVGTPIPLCSGVDRWKAAEVLLRVLADKSLQSRVSKVLQAPHVSCNSPDYLNRPGAFEGTRLSIVTENTKLQREELKKALVLDLIDHAPFEFMWLNTFGATDAREALVKAITDSSVSLEDALGGKLSKLAPYTTQLLALRGFVAFGVLEHCLEKRYRVNFGLPAPGTRHKKIAIPFRAADVPSERSEFSHPDVCIMLTFLGYYHGGLRNEELKNAFDVLLQLDKSEQQYLYDQWFTSVKVGLSVEDQKALCDVRHISLADTRQFETLCRVYRFCMEVINFYLSSCVFPKDTQQYPQRLSRTAWNLAAGKNNIGFSGTNDNHRLLPLSVQQVEPDEPFLSGANGKMIDMIVKVTHSYEMIPTVCISSQRLSIPWESVLRFTVVKKAQALIDTGALLAGVANDVAAEFLLDQPDFSFAGVTYYDSSAENNCWMLAEKTRRIKVPLKKASMLEKETFVIFDEARSRGSDMKLLPEAAAVLTLGPKLTKDKLMQGAGRMRQLGCNQTLWLASFDEVAQSVLQVTGRCELSSVSAIDVLNWVMDNTKAEAVRGLLEWATNGIHFRKTQLDRNLELVDENWTLERLYQEKLRVDKIAQVIKSKAQFDFRDCADELIAEICETGLVYGLDDEVCVTSHTDECERELQVEEEVQQECEVETVECSPAKEKLWAFERILRAQSIEDLKTVVRVLDMAQFIRQWIYPKELASLAWPSARIYGTENFFATTEARRGVDRLNEFVRVIDVALVFKNRQVLLVSECEADHILELLWSTKIACSFSFVNFSFVCESLNRFGGFAKIRDGRLALGSGLDRELPLLSTIACHVFNGETTVAKHQDGVVEPALREFLRPLEQRETTLSNFVASRGNGHKWTRSFLHQLCCRMDLEDCK
ncbi:hypothetical protein DVH05_015410 [Phytophthora capsici]|nr:hypothetical protein DVH05_015410 [Phytophthora capsici]